MGARTITFLCLVGIVDAVMMPVKRVGPSEGLAVKKISTFAEDVTKAALNDATTLGTSRALEDVMQLGQVARVAIADELGVSPSQAFTEDMVLKSIMAAGTVAGDVAGSVSDAAGHTDADDRNSEGEEDAGEASSEAELDLDSEFGSGFIEAARAGKFDGAEATENMAEFAINDIMKGIATTIQNTFGSDVPEMELEGLGPNTPKEDKEKVIKVVDKMDEMVTEARDALKESLLKEDPPAASDSAEGEQDSNDSAGEVKLDMHKVAFNGKDELELYKEVSRKVVEALDEAKDDIKELKEELAGDDSEADSDDDSEDPSAVDEEGVADIAAAAIDAVAPIIDAVAPVVGEVAEGISEGIADLSEDNATTEDSDEDGEAHEVVKKVASGLHEIAEGFAPVVDKVLMGLEELLGEDDEDDE